METHKNGIYFRMTMRPTDTRTDKFLAKFPRYVRVVGICIAHKRHMKVLSTYYPGMAQIIKNNFLHVAKLARVFV